MQRPDRKARDPGLPLAAQLQRHVYVKGRPRRGQNKQVLYSIDALHEAINAGRQVSFRYGEDREHRVSPYHLAYEGGAYYLIAYQDYADPAGIRHYRVDRMHDVRVLHEQPRAGRELFDGFDLPAYLTRHFNMYGGPEYTVTLRCAGELRETMRDRFGQGPGFADEPDGSFHFAVPVCVSNQFYGWVCGFGGKVTVTAPGEVRAALAALGALLTESYGE